MCAKGTEYECVVDCEAVTQCGWVVTVEMAIPSIPSHPSHPPFHFGYPTRARFRPTVRVSLFIRQACIQFLHRKAPTATLVYIRDHCSKYMSQTHPLAPSHTSVHHPSSSRPQ